jgi:tetratricopeptide (TPR) repeat protein
LAAYARANGRLWFFDPGSNAEETSRLTLELAERAVAAAPERGDALLALAQVTFGRTEYEQAARLAKRALARSPLLPEAHELVGRVLLEVGPLEQGISMMERAHSLDPLDESPIMELARGYALMGDFERLRRFLESNPPQRGMVSRAPLIARYGIWSGRPQEWFTLLPSLDSVELLSPQTLALVAKEVVETGQLAPRFEALLLHLETTSERPARLRVLLGQIGAEFHAYLGNDDAALPHVENAVHAGLIDLSWLERCPLFTRLRELPRFSELSDGVRERAQAIRRALDEG